jgi:hypothetical protein
MSFALFSGDFFGAWPQAALSPQLSNPAQLVEDCGFLHYAPKTYKTYLFYIINSENC